MKQWKGFVSGILVTLLVLGMGGAAMAAVAQKQATLDYNDIKITLDGKAVTPTDANGQTVEPFAIEGTTYLPVRAVANALGLGVEWDGATKTVKLTNSGSSTPAESTTAGTLVMETNGLKITYTGVNYDGTFGTDIKFQVENTTDKSYTVQAREVSVNGYMVDPIMSIDVGPGKKANDEMTIMKSDMEKNGITTIETVELKFQIYVTDKMSENFKTETVVINCK